MKNRGEHMTIRDILIKYSQELEKISDTPRLDVELFLQKALGDVDRIYIHLNLNKELTKEQKDALIAKIKKNKEILEYYAARGDNDAAFILNDITIPESMLK